MTFQVLGIKAKGPYQVFFRISERYMEKGLFYEISAVIFYFLAHVPDRLSGVEFEEKFL